MSANRLRIALPKGRLWEAAIARLARAGMAPLHDKGRKLLVPSEDPGIEFLEIKPGDVDNNQSGRRQRSQRGSPEWRGVDN